MPIVSFHQQNRPWSTMIRSRPHDLQNQNKQIGEPLLKPVPEIGF